MFPHLGGRVVLPASPKLKKRNGLRIQHRTCNPSDRRLFQGGIGCYPATGERFRGQTGRFSQNPHHNESRRKVHSGSDAGADSHLNGIGSEGFENQPWGRDDSEVPRICEEGEYFVAVAGEPDLLMEREFFQLFVIDFFMVGMRRLSSATQS